MTDADSKKYQKVKERFDAYFVKCINVIFERARFNQCKQEEGETVETFIASLHKHCNYGTMLDEMIQDRLVVGLRDAALSQKLQLEAELTLDSAVTTTEEVKSQQAELRNDSSSTVEAVHKASARETESTTRSTCTRCGRAPSHEFQQCPARSKMCRKCHRRGHV